MPHFTFACLPACFSTALATSICPLAENCEIDGGGVTPPPIGGGLVIPQYN